MLRHRIHRLRDADGGRGRPLQVDRPGSRSISRASSAIGGGIVALKNSVCRRGGNVPQDAPDVGQKPHVEHAVGLVEHEVLQAGQFRVRAAEMIEQPARRRRR